MHCEVQRQAAILPCARCQHTIARLLPVRRRAADTSTLFLDTLPWLHAAAVGEAAMLADRKLKFVPDMDGFALPNALHWLLLPLSKRTVRSAPLPFGSLQPWQTTHRRPESGFRCPFLCSPGAVLLPLQDVLQPSRQSALLQHLCRWRSCMTYRRGDGRRCPGADALRRRCCAAPAASGAHLYMIYSRRMFPVTHFDVSVILRGEVVSCCWGNLAVLALWAVYTLSTLPALWQNALHLHSHRRSLQAEEMQAAGEAVELPFATPNVPWRPFSAAQWVRTAGTFRHPVCTSTPFSLTNWRMPCATINCSACAELCILTAQVAEFYANAFPEAAAAAEDEQDGSGGHAGGGMTVLIATAQVHAR